jgi:uncharacterized membrane protein YebE (DUF533 family)
LSVYGEPSSPAACSSRADPTCPRGAYAPRAAPPQEDPDFSDRVKAIIADVRALAEADGDVSEQERLAVEQITTLIQKLAAGREKEQQDMLGGKMSPAAMQRAYSG